MLSHFNVPFCLLDLYAKHSNLGQASLQHTSYSYLYNEMHVPASSCIYHLVQHRVNSPSLNNPASLIPRIALSSSNTGPKMEVYLLNSLISLDLPLFYVSLGAKTYPDSLKIMQNGNSMKAFSSWPPAFIETLFLKYFPFCLFMSQIMQPQW